MFDFVKIELPVPAEEFLKRSGEIGLTVRNQKENQTTFGFGNLKLNAYTEKVILSGSIHKFYNTIRRRGDQNHDDFTHANLIDCIEYLSRFLGLDLWESRIQNLEYGVNVPLDARDVLPNIICMKGREKSSNRRFSGGGRLIEFEYTQFWLKLYDKSAQHRLRSPSIRIEIKARKNQYLKNSFGISTLSDLKRPEKILELKKDLIGRVDSILIAQEPPHFSCFEEQLMIKDGLNPHYWVKLKEEQPSALTDEWDRFNAYVRSKGLDSEKQELLSAVEQKWNDLMAWKPVQREANKRRIITFLHLGKGEVKRVLEWVREIVVSWKGTFNDLIRMNSP